MKCGICQSKINDFLTVKDWRGSNHIFNIKKCYKCQTITTTPIINDKNITYYYQNYISHTDNSKSIFDKLYFLIKRININYKIKIIEKYINSGFLLDYGCGTGSFLNKLDKNKWDVSGIEIDKKAREIALNKIPDKIYPPHNYIEKKINVITLWHVFEHIQDINKLLYKMYHWLKPDGLIFIAIPNYNSYDCKKYKQYWAAWDVPIHRYHFNKYSMKYIAEQNNFTLIKTHNLIFDSFYISMISEKNKRSSLWFIKGLFNGLLSFIKSIKTNEASSIIYVLKK